jgi:hypothetical protein
MSSCGYFLGINTRSFNNNSGCVPCVVTIGGWLVLDSCDSVEALKRRIQVASAIGKDGNGPRVSAQQSTSCSFVRDLAALAPMLRGSRWFERRRGGF